MYIIYDARHFEDYYSGLSRYSFSVIKELIFENNFNKLDVIFNSNCDYSTNPLFNQLTELAKHSKIKFVYLNANIFSFKQHLIVAKYVNRSNCDRYFYPHFDSPVFLKKKVIFVVHDLFPLVLDSYVLKFSFLKRIYFRLIIHINLFKKNTQCIAVSKTTKKDLVKFFGRKFVNKITVIYEDSFSDANSCSEPTKNLLEIIDEKKYLFYIGGRRRHKNLKQMIDIFSLLMKEKLYDGYFIIAGSSKDFYFDLEDYIKNKKNIIVLGKINDSELSYLYSNMDALFFLSKYEGFGLPIIESAKYNKKIITTSLGACGEISPSTSLKLNIESDDFKLAKIISQYLFEEFEIDNDIYLNSFSWAKTSRHIIESRSI